MSTIKGQSGQSVYDIALQAYGDASGIFDVFSENPLLIQSADVTQIDVVINANVVNQNIVDNIFSNHTPVSN